MFKAFTKNITSFIGVSSDQSSEEKQSEETPDNTGKSEASQSETDDRREVGDVKQTEATSSKVPPPRPAPPLTPATSVSKPDTPPDSPSKQQGKDETAAEPKGDGDTDSGKDNESVAGTENSEASDKKNKKDDKFEEVTEKAKQWGNYLFSVTKTAGASVSAKAKELKKVVQENTIIGDFVKEQDKFVNEKKEKARASEAAVPPWVGYNEEDQMKQQMLTLSNDKRNFLRNPPAGVQFHFDYETCYPVAMATLAQDEKLQKMRFELVPKNVSEHDFWRNYFYRVSLIKQSTQLTSLAKQQSSSPATTDSQTTGELSSPSSVPGSTNTGTIADHDPGSDPAKKSDAAGSADQTDLTDDADLNPSSAAAGGGVQEAEFVSDMAYNLEISDEDLLREMEALRSTSPGTDGEWDLLGASAADGLDADEAALEREIMAEMNQSKSVEDLK